MEAKNVSYADDIAEDAGADRRKRIAADNWQHMPNFAFVAPSAAALASAALPGIIILGLWLAVASLLLIRVTRRLGARQ
jgi:ABC-2 type transport system permease protein